MTTWLLLLAAPLALLWVTLLSWSRREELRRMRAGRAEQEQARARGTDRARLQYPAVDLSRCIGCGICIEACPEEGVLELVHGQAVVAHGSRCVGHGKCAEECPVGAIAVTLGDLSQRRDIPVLEPSHESPHTPGLFLAGEVTGFALIRTAVEHGRMVAREVARKLESLPPVEDPSVLDLLIVGAGPAGLTCALEARERGLRFAVVEQDSLGGTIAHYPRRKLVMTQPVQLPLHGRLARSEYEKEELVALWEELATEHDLPLRTQTRFEGVERDENGVLGVITSAGRFRARTVCLALGRRGTPRRLGVEGEDLPKVASSLIDAQSYRGRRILVVGGGDSAVEAALGLAEQPGNKVSLSYRGLAFTRIKARNEGRLEAAVRAGKLELLLGSQVQRISSDAVELAVGEDGRRLTLPNDEVFVLIGGEPPFALLERCGVSLDPADRRPPPVEDEDPSLVRGLALASLVALAAAAFAFAYQGYFRTPLAERPLHPEHDLLRPAQGMGLVLGAFASLLVLANLAYLVRRSQALPLTFGSLRAWMTVHVATGIGALLLALLHGGLVPRDTSGGHALWGLAVLVLTGAIGRWLYALVPRAANGRELQLDEVRDRLAQLSGNWAGSHRAFGERLEAEVGRLVDDIRWSGGLGQRLAALLIGRRRAHRHLRDLAATGRREGVPAEEVDAGLVLARSAFDAALAASRYEELRGLLGSWRYLHRWVAVAMVLLVLAHIVTASRYADLRWPWSEGVLP